MASDVIDSLRLLWLDDRLFSEDNDYLEKACPEAKRVYKKILGLISEGRFDSPEGEHYTGFYGQIRERYLRGTYPSYF